MIEYAVLDETNIPDIANKYVEYYNLHEGGCWTLEKAYKRIHQIVSIEDSYCLIQQDHQEITGFAIGYFKQYDDLTAYYLEEIVIFAAQQNKGYGKAFLSELERAAKERGAEHMELVSVNDELHMHFYMACGMYAANNLRIMGKHFPA